MKFTFHTSLIALIFAIGATDTFAAPAVRQLGGGFTGPGAGNTSTGMAGNTLGGNINTKPAGITSSRAGSIRSTPRPTVSSNGSAPVATVASGTADTNRSASTQQRLSIGGYIGAPRQISSGGGGDTTEITNDIKNINNEIQNITNILDDVEADISGKVDKEQGINKAGQALVVGSDGWVTTSEFVTPGELDVDLSGKVDKNQGIGEAGKALLVNADGIVTTGDVLKPGDVDLSGKVDVLQGRQYKGKALVVDNDGKLKPIGEFMTPGEVDISGKVDKFQGPEHAGNALIVDQYGNVQPTGDFVDADQGEENVGKALMIDAQGRVVPGDVDFTDLEVDISGKVDKNQGEENAGKILSVGSDGYVTTTAQVDISGKVDKFQGIDAKDKVLTVGADGFVTPGKNVYSQSETDTLLSAKLNNTADAEEHGGKALIVDPETGEIRPGDVNIGELEVDLSGKVDKFQTTDNADTVLVVNEEGYVADEKIRNVHVADDAALERKKMAADITGTLDWVDVWKNDESRSENTRYVMAVNEFGEQEWFRVVVDE